MDSLCHPWFTTTNLSYRFPIFETSATALCGTTGTCKSVHHVFGSPIMDSYLLCLLPFAIFVLKHWIWTAIATKPTKPPGPTVILLTRHCRLRWFSCCRTSRLPNLVMELVDPKLSRLSPAAPAQLWSWFHTTSDKYLNFSRSWWPASMLFRAYQTPR